MIKHLLLTFNHIQTELWLLCTRCFFSRVVAKVLFVFGGWYSTGPGCRAASAIAIYSMKRYLSGIVVSSPPWADAIVRPIDCAKVVVLLVDGGLLGEAVFRGFT